MSRMPLRPALRNYAHAPAAAPVSAWENTKSCLFDGSDDKYIADSAATWATGDWSISFWTKCPTASAGLYWLISAGPDWGLNITNYYGRIRISWNGNLSSTGLALVSHTWYHVVCSWVSSTTTGSIFLDGVAAGTSGSITGNANASNALHIGVYYNDGSSYAYPGNIDEIGIYDGVALDVTDAVALYNSGTPTDLEIGPSADQLLYYYRMGDDDSDSPTVLVDQKGNINCTGSGGVTVESDVP